MKREINTMYFFFLFSSFMMFTLYKMPATSLCLAVNRNRIFVLSDIMSLLVSDDGFTPQDNIVHGGSVRVKPMLIGYFVRPDGQRFVYQYEAFFRIGLGKYNKYRTVVVITAPVMEYIIATLCMLYALCLLSL